MKILLAILTASLLAPYSLCQESQGAADATRGKNLSTVNKYSANWQSVKKHKTPDWFLDAKFGIYFHWGPYSVPAHKTEWYSIHMYQDGHPIRKYHEKNYGTLDVFGYKDFIPMFKAEKFNPESWADLFQKSGAKFAGPVAEHADGFAMWDSKITAWNAKNMGPKSDVVGELAKAIRARNMKFIATFHHHWKYAWYPTWDKSTDASKPEYEDLYGPKVAKGTFNMADTPTNPLPGKKFNDEWLAKIVEVIDNYKPDLLYFDNKMDIIQEKTRLDMLAYFYNAGIRERREVVVTYKFHDLLEGSAVLDLERSRMSETKGFPWLTDDSIDWNSWSHVKKAEYKSTNRLIDFLADVVSKNGVVLLNITPTASGEIPPPVERRLLEVGKWLSINGEAIYGTRPWKIYGEGPAKVVEGHLSERQNSENTEDDIRFTTKDGNLYAIVLDWPSKPIEIRALAKKSKKINNIELLGSAEIIHWKQEERGLVIETPKHQHGKHAFVFKLTFK